MLLARQSIALLASTVDKKGRTFKNEIRPRQGNSAALFKNNDLRRSANETALADDQGKSGAQGKYQLGSLGLVRLQ